MIKAGLPISSRDTYWNSLIEIDNTAQSGKATFEKFCSKYHLPPRFHDIAIQEYYSGMDNIPLKLVPGALDCLAKLRFKHTLILVTMGVEEDQYKKMIRVGINPEWFETIIITHHYDKAIHYKHILNSLHVPSSNIVVCGDKFKTDLLPALELGMWTIHIQWGRGLEAEYTQSPHYIVSTLENVPLIIDEIQCKP